MPRAKGSRNKKKAVANVDYAALIEEKLTEKADTASQIDAKNEELTTLKTELKELKAQAKSLDKEIAKLQAVQAAKEAAEVEEAKKAELEEVLKQLMAEGMSAQEILDKLK